MHLKAENLQRTGSFKIRGAVNKLSTLGEAERAAGVVAASAGNHAQAVAWAAREAGVGATIFVPQDAAMAKVEATKGYGAEVRMVGQGIEEALAEARKLSEETGATFVHPFEDETVVAGQGTIGLELAEQVPLPRRCSCRSAAAGSPPGSAWRCGRLLPGRRWSASAPPGTHSRSRTGSRSRSRAS